jgi:hypothetical protein
MLSPGARFQRFRHFDQLRPNLGHTHSLFRCDLNCGELRIARFVNADAQTLVERIDALIDRRRESQRILESVCNAVGRRRPP